VLRLATQLLLKHAFLGDITGQGEHASELVVDDGWQQHEADVAGRILAERQHHGVLAQPAVQRRTQRRTQLVGVGRGDDLEP